jgi:hypothetical protein
MMCDVAYAGMNSMANVNICLKIVGVTSPSQLCLSKKKEVVSVRLLQFGFTATDLEEAYMAFEGEKDDSPAVDNAPAAALTDDQLERQRVNGELDTHYKHKLGDFRRRIPSALNAIGRVCVWTRRPTRGLPGERARSRACCARRQNICDAVRSVYHYADRLRQR